MASEAGKNTEAMEWISRSPVIEAKYPQALYLRGKLLADAGKLSEAQTDLKAAAEQDPTWSAPHYQLSRLYRRMGKSDLAEGEAKMVAELDARAKGSQSAELREYLDSLTLPSGR